ncbi:kinesin-like nuclear fusion protein [Orbilia oligospora]|nr:kinesin-like nuclear fusion protein [Orbilia oligospora]
MKSALLAQAKKITAVAALSGLNNSPVKGDIDGNALCGSVNSSPNIHRLQLVPISPSNFLTKRYPHPPPFLLNNHPASPDKDRNKDIGIGYSGGLATTDDQFIGPKPATRVGVNEAFLDPEPPPLHTLPDMQSSLPRPGGSRLPAPSSASTANSSIPQSQSGAQPLTDLGESTVNSRHAFSTSVIGKPSILSTSTIGKPSILSTSVIGKPSALKGRNPLSASTSLKRPLENTDSPYDRPTQVARSAISQNFPSAPASAARGPTGRNILGKSTVGRTGASRIGAAAKGALNKSTLGKTNAALAAHNRQIEAAVASGVPLPQDEAEEETENEKGSSGPWVAKKRPSRAGWDVKGRLADLEEDHREMMERFADTNVQKDMSSMKVIELETMRATLETRNSQLQSELNREQAELNKTRMELHEEQRLRRIEADDARRQLLNETDELRRKARDDIDNLERKQKTEVSDLTSKHKSEVDELRMALERLKMEQAEDKRRHADELNTLKTNAARDLEDAQQRSRNELSDLKNRSELEVATLKNTSMTEIATLKATYETELAKVKGELKAETSAHNETKDELAVAQKMNKDMRNTLSEQSVNSLNMESSARALRDKICSLESMISDRDSSIRAKDGDVSQMRKDLETAMTKLRTEETLRRKLHNQVLELKGNIRVFCRVRPTLEAESEPAKIDFPGQDDEAKDIKLYCSEKATLSGAETVKEHPYTFDKVFNPTADNNLIFEEISQLVQSALDGYNVCIFAYGQTGSGKTFTMTSKDGMIPQAVEQIFRTSAQLTEKGWTYTMEGSFVEVYNENLNDLLGKDTDIDKKKIEIRHDKGRTMLTECTTIALSGPDMMEEVMRRASNNRMVAATKANERSSRSHSVFILKLFGQNNITGEKCEGTLNLVDLAGSERLSHSQATGDRLKETQNINKSLSALGDVISALGGGKEVKHIPYRNSKLTFLLQNSLGGNSKTLMFVMVSPLLAHMNETLTSLKFAKKVSQVNIGTAKKVKVDNVSP